MSASDVRLRLWDGESWRKAAEGMERLRETTVEAQAQVEALGYEMTQTLLRPHRVRMKSGVWWCSRCGAASADPEIIQEVECRER